jgi:hypothetical protein
MNIVARPRRGVCTAPYNRNPWHPERTAPSSPASLIAATVMLGLMSPPAIRPRTVIGYEATRTGDPEDTLATTDQPARRRSRRWRIALNFHARPQLPEGIYFRKKRSGMSLANSDHMGVFRGTLRSKTGTIHPPRRPPQNHRNAKFYPHGAAEPRKTRAKKSGRIRRDPAASSFDQWRREKLKSTTFWQWAVSHRRTLRPTDSSASFSRPASARRRGPLPGRSGASNPFARALRCRSSGGPSARSVRRRSCCIGS